MTPRLECSNLRVGYGNLVVVDDFSASFEGGSMTAIVGPSGSGKSTLLFALGLLLNPRSGAVLIDGVHTAKLDDQRLSALRARSIGFVFQSAHLDRRQSVLRTVLEPSIYAGLNPRKLESRALQLLDELEIGVPPDRRCDRLSSGQEQRIALCRAELLDPSIVLADEPTGNLDPGNSAAVFGHLRRLTEAGSAVVLVTHSPDQARSCDFQMTLGTR